MDKDKILNAVNAVQGGADGAGYYDELEVVIGLIVNATDEGITAICKEIHEDAETDPE